MLDYLGDGLLLWLQLALSLASLAVALFVVYVVARSASLLVGFVVEYRRQPARDRDTWLEERLFWLQAGRRRRPRRRRDDD